MVSFLLTPVGEERMLPKKKESYGRHLHSTIDVGICYPVLPVYIPFFSMRSCLANALFYILAKDPSLLVRRHCNEGRF